MACPYDLLRFRNTGSKAYMYFFQICAVRANVGSYALFSQLWIRASRGMLPGAVFLLCYEVAIVSFLDWDAW